MKVEQFGDFRLDRSTGQLLLRGRELVLQPRVFQLLAYLVNNRDRVIDKEELLSAIWPGLVVTDASLQRAISLVRGALREGGLENAVRTYSRRGYRFCMDATSDNGTRATDDVLMDAREAFAQGDWSEAIARFERADRQQPLHAADLERWGIATQCAACARPLLPWNALAPSIRPCGMPRQPRGSA